MLHTSSFYNQIPPAPPPPTPRTHFNNIAGKLTHLFQNCGPISVLWQSFLSALLFMNHKMERCVHKHIFNYISENSLLTPFQSGFIQGDSTTFQLLHTYHSFLEAVDGGKEVRVVFCDISKALDRVWHKGL